MKGLLRKLTGRTRRFDPEATINANLELFDDHDEPIDPVSLSDPSEVRKALVEHGNVRWHVRRSIGGEWVCVSHDNCDHAEKVYAVVEEWANLGGGE